MILFIYLCHSSRRDTVTDMGDKPVLPTFVLTSERLPSRALM